MVTKTHNNSHAQMGEPKNIKRLCLVKSLDILNPKSKTNTLYLIAFKSVMFCRINTSSSESWYFSFPPSIVRVSGKTKCHVHEYRGL